AAYDSVQLFAERAARARAGFALDEQNLSDVVRICQHLDGLPLGIELAAAKVRRWTPAEIAQSIQHDLDFLTTTQDEVPARHRSLRAVFETSWRQRSPAERQALVQLSVFRGEFSRQAALAVAGATPPDLTALADRSLLHQPATGRYQMSESVRQFAAEKLAALAQEHVVDIPALRDRHSTFYLGFVAQHQAALHGREPHQAVAEILREAQNIRRAWSWAVSQGQFTLIHRGLRSMSRLIRLSGLCLEGEMIFAQAVEQLRAILVTAEQPARDKQFVLGELLAEYACCLNSLARYDQAIAAAQEVVDLALAHHAASLEAVGRLQLGRALRQQGDYAAAQAQVERALAQARAANVPALEANSLDQLGILTARDNYPLARTWLEQALRLYQELGDALGEAEALHDLGLGALSQGIYDGARAYLEQSLRIFCQIDNRWGEAMSCWSLGNVADALGDYVKAQAYYERALGITRLIGERTGEAETLASLAWTLYHQDQDDAAWHVGQQAVDLARTLGNRRIEGRALTALGHALAALGLQAEAITVYRQALSVYQDLGESNLITGPLAGLARVTLVQGNLAQALALADQVLEHLDGLPPSSEGQSFEAYWICYQVLQANQDPRAAEVLHASYHLLQEYAARIGDPVRRRSLLDAPRVAAHRAIIHEFEQSQR
ncbi:MAG: tetratricopeptide repeat protein, partial [Chloroflexi bacterium]|nr:tetratricopeptide repeat protein [Chloroflexota bacterium]